jgi:hypothetical protein
MQLIPGLAYEPGMPMEIHRWTGDGLVIFLWLGVPFAGVIVLHQKLARKTVIAVVQTLVVVTALVFASFTGYLGPLRNLDNLEETNQRLVVLHEVVLPTMLSLLLVTWLFALRPLVAMKRPSPANEEPSHISS